MARAVESIDRIIGATDILPTTVERTAAFLQQIRTDLWPLSGKGGGKAAVHVEPYHLVNLILGLAAEQPSDAGTAVRLLRETTLFELPRRGMADRFWTKLIQIAPEPQPEAYDQTDDNEVGNSGGTWLNSLTAQLAALPPQERLEFAEISAVHGAEIVMCIDPPSIVLTWKGQDYRREEVHFSSGQPLEKIFPSPEITARRRRLTSFPVTILVVAAELAADTWRRRAADPSFPPSGSSPESENASGLPGPEAPTRTNRPRKPRSTGSLTTPETKRVCADYQAHIGSRGLHPFLEEPQGYDTRPPNPLGAGATSP